MTITVSLWDLRNTNGEIRVFVFQDAPEFRNIGGQADLRRHEVLEFLERAGSSEEEARQLLEDVLRQSRVHRRRFQLSAEQLAHLREFTPELGTSLTEGSVGL